MTKFNISVTVDTSDIANALFEDKNQETAKNIIYAIDIEQGSYEFTREVAEKFIKDLVKIEMDYPEDFSEDDESLLEFVAKLYGKKLFKEV